MAGQAGLRVKLVGAEMRASNGSSAAPRTSRSEPNAALRIITRSAAAGRTIVLSGVAAAVVGGVSLFGGRGRLVHAALGALVISIIDNGLGLLGFSAGISFVVTGTVLALAATVDAVSRRRGGTVRRM